MVVHLGVHRRAVATNREAAMVRATADKKGRAVASGRRPTSIHRSQTPLHRAVFDHGGCLLSGPGDSTFYSAGAAKAVVLIVCMVSSSYLNSALLYFNGRWRLNELLRFFVVLGQDGLKTATWVGN